MGDVEGFLIRGCFWVAAGLAIAAVTDLSGAGQAILFAGWLAGLAVTALIAARQWPTPAYSPISSAAAQLVMAVALLAVLRHFPPS